VRVWLTPRDDVTQITIAELAQVVGVGVAVVVVCGNLVGALSPLVLKRCGFDPAVMSNPVVSSLVDVTGIMAYFAVASALLG
jgi:magnesium transporter